jgi:hypothetical protein
MKQKSQERQNQNQKSESNLSDEDRELLEEVIEIGADRPVSKSMYVAEIKQIKNENERSMTMFARDIDGYGEGLIKNMELKRQLSEHKRMECIAYILKHSNDYQEYNLLNYDLNEVSEIYAKVKEQNKSLILKLIKFILG